MDTNNKQPVNDPDYIGSAMQLFYDDLHHSHVEQLPEPELRELIRRAQDGDNSARNKAVLANMPLVIYWTRRKCAILSDQIAEEDVMQNGTLGLMKAIEMFNLESDAKFSTFASDYINTYIRQQTNFSSRTVDVPYWLISSAHKCREIKDSFVQEYGHDPTKEELAKLLNVSLKTLDTILEYSASDAGANKTVSGDSDSRNISDDPLLNISRPSVEDDYMDSETQQMVRQAVEQLPNPLSREIIKMRFGIDPYPNAMSYSEITRTFTNAGIKTAIGTEYSRSRIAFLGAQAIEKLKSILGGELQ